MKLMTLNIWGGHITEPLLAFIELHRDVDIFCFQEVYDNAPDKISTEDRPVCLDIFSKIKERLPMHHGYFRPVVGKIYGIAMLVKKTIDVIEEGEIVIHDNVDYPGKGPTHSRNLQWLQYRANHKIYSIMNVHALWNGKGKLDTPERIAQSRRISDFMSTIHSPKILCGDFNLRPDTESLNLISQGMTNLVHSHNIKSTRNKHYTKEERFADYIFTSPDISVKAFTVLQDEVSDHLPLLLEYKI